MEGVVRIGREKSRRIVGEVEEERGWDEGDDEDEAVQVMEEG